MAKRKSDTLTKSEKLNWRTTIVIGSISICVALAGVWYAKKGIDTGLQIAQQAGSFDKANNYLGISTFDLPDIPEDTVRLVYGGVFDLHSINISALPFSIGNYGKKNGEDVELVIEYPTTSDLAFTDTALLMASQTPIGKIKRTWIQGNEMQTITYELNHLNPGVRFTIMEPIYIHKTETQVTKSVETKKLTFKVEYSMFFKTTLLGKDLKTQTRLFSIKCIEAANMDELIDKFTHQINRGEAKNNYYYFIYPEKQLFGKHDKTSINEYNIMPRSIYFGIIDDLKPKKDIILALYNGDQKLEKVRAYDENNNFKVNIPAK